MQKVEQHIIKDDRFKDWCVKAKNLYNSGIYQITNVVTNDFYIGSAIKFNRRKTNHFSRLVRGVHPNKHLQSSFTKYGKDAFRFDVLAFCPIPYLIKLEQWFLDNLKPTFNKHPKANSSFGTKHDEAYSQQMRINNLDKKRTQESKDRMSSARIGIHKSEQHKSSIAKSIGIKVTNQLTGEIFNSIKECAAKNGFSETTMKSIIDKKVAKYRNLDFKKEHNHNQRSCVAQPNKVNVLYRKTKSI